MTTPTANPAPVPFVSKHPSEYRAKHLGKQLDTVFDLPGPDWLPPLCLYSFEFNGEMDNGDPDDPDTVILILAVKDSGVEVNGNTISKVYAEDIGLIVYPEDSDGSTILGAPGAVVPVTHPIIIGRKFYQELVADVKRWEGTGVKNVAFMESKKDSSDEDASIEAMLDRLMSLLGDAPEEKDSE